MNTENNTQSDLAPADGIASAETTAERERRAKRTFPIRIFTGSAEDGWKLASPESFNEEPAALRWVRDNGVVGQNYMLARVHTAQRCERAFVDVAI